MFLPLNHKNLDVYKAARELLKESYWVSKKLPSEERFNLVQQIRRAALSIKLNIAEGSSRKSLPERKRIDAIAESIIDLEYLTIDSLENLGKWLNKCFSMLSKML